MLTVYWNEYQLEKKKKYIVYFTGNFSPPHKSHIARIEPYFNKKNVQILIHLWGNEKRHNIPIETSFEILKIYFKDVNNVTIEKFDPLFTNIYKQKKLDYLLFIRGNEDFNTTIKTDYLNTYSDLIKNLRKKGVTSLVLIKDRTPKNISSTEMCKYRNSDGIFNFLPEFLTIEEKIKIKEIFDLKRILNE